MRFLGTVLIFISLIIVIYTAVIGNSIQDYLLAGILAIYARIIQASVYNAESKSEKRNIKDLFIR